LKRQSGNDIIVMGNISLAQSLMKDRLIDEYRLVICPFVLPAGRALFGGVAGAIDVPPQGAATVDRGGVSLKYAQRST